MSSIGYLETSRRAAIELPDRLIFNLDPDEAFDFTKVADAADHFRDTLFDFGLVSFAMLGGVKGVHVVVPLPRGIHGRCTKTSPAASLRSSSWPSGLTSGRNSAPTSCATDYRRTVPLVGATSQIAELTCELRES